MISLNVLVSTVILCYPFLYDYVYNLNLSKHAFVILNLHPINIHTYIDKASQIFLKVVLVVSVLVTCDVRNHTFCMHVSVYCLKVVHHTQNIEKRDIHYYAKSTH